MALVGDVNDNPVEIRMELTIFCTLSKLGNLGSDSL